MNYIQGKRKELYLLTNEIETIFLHEYMPGAPGDHVKVYLFGLMYAQLGAEMDHETLARQLRLPLEAVHQAWTYWADLGVVAKRPNGRDYDVEFLSLRERMYGQSAAESAEEPAETSLPGDLDGSQLKGLLSDMERISGKVFSARDMEEIYSWVRELGASPALILFATEYCYERGKTNIRYIAKVVAQWREQGFSKVEDAKAYLQALDQRHSIHKRILQALGLNRSATEAEKELMNRWLDEMHFNLDRILEACGRTVSISNPNLRYVDKILDNWHQEAQRDGRDVNKKVTVTQTVLNRYYAYLRETEEKAVQDRQKEVYGRIPRLQAVDEEIVALGSKLSRELLSGTAREGLQAIREQIRTLEGERAVLLTDNGYPMDYTDRRYLCDRCKDTGVTEDGKRCSCTRKRIEEAELWQKTS